jgi:hypothetical protein
VLGAWLAGLKSVKQILPMHLAMAMGAEPGCSRGAGGGLATIDRGDFTRGT